VFLHREEIDALIAAPDPSTWIGRRERTFLIVAVQTGLRVSELIGLRCQDVVLGTGAHVTCVGKGRKQRATTLSEEAAAMLGSWLQERNGLPQEPVFPSSRGGPLSRDAIERLVAKHAQTPGIENVPPRTEAQQQRHRLAMMDGLPEGYRELRNPLPASPRVVAKGKRQFQAHCIVCHGETGEGEGPAAEGMVPPPANLRWVMSRPMAWDGYPMWSISQGGAALGSSMPAYENTLGESGRWWIIRYLRTI
jgi:mono/diheme cytochrome c family protein